MKKLNNINTIRLFEIFETKNSLYLVLELIQGGELLKRISKNKGFKESDVKVLMKKIFLALEHFHSNKIIHRDLKPDNLLLRSEDNIHDIVIADFGLACQLNGLEILFKRCGTPGYVAPEVLHWQEGNSFYNTKCDIFSVGCILYLMLFLNFFISLILFNIFFKINYLNLIKKFFMRLLIGYYKYLLIYK